MSLTSAAGAGRGEVLLERELSLLIHQLVQDEGYATFESLVRRMSKSSVLTSLLAARGIKFPYRALPIVEGINFIQRELTLTVQLNIGLNPLCTGEDIANRLLIRFNTRGPAYTPIRCRTFADLGVGRIENAPAIVDNFIVPRVENPIWISGAQVLAALAKQPRVTTWRDAYTAAAISLGVEPTRVIIPRRILTEAYFAHCQGIARQLAGVAELEQRQYAKRAAQLLKPAAATLPVQIVAHAAPASSTRDDAAAPATADVGVSLTATIGAAAAAPDTAPMDVAAVRALVPPPTHEVVCEVARLGVQLGLHCFTTNQNRFHQLIHCRWPSEGHGEIAASNAAASTLTARVRNAFLLLCAILGITLRAAEYSDIISETPDVLVPVQGHQALLTVTANKTVKVRRLKFAGAPSLAVVTTHSTIQCWLSIASEIGIDSKRHSRLLRSKLAQAAILAPRVGAAPPSDLNTLDANAGEDDDEASGDDDDASDADDATSGAVVSPARTSLAAGAGLHEANTEVTPGSTGDAEGAPEWCRELVRKYFLHIAASLGIKLLVGELLVTAQHADMLPLFEVTTIKPLALEKVLIQTRVMQRSRFFDLAAARQTTSPRPSADAARASEADSIDSLAEFAQRMRDEVASFSTLSVASDAVAHRLLRYCRDLGHAPIETGRLYQLAMDAVKAPGSALAGASDEVTLSALLGSAASNAASDNPGVELQQSSEAAASASSVVEQVHAVFNNEVTEIIHTLSDGDRSDISPPQLRAAITTHFDVADAGLIVPALRTHNGDDNDGHDSALTWIKERCADVTSHGSSGVTRVALAGVLSTISAKESA